MAAEDTRPFAEGEVGGDDDRGALVEPRDPMEEQLTAGLREGEIDELVKHGEVESGEVIGDGSCLPARCSVLRRLTRSTTFKKRPRAPARMRARAIATIRTAASFMMIHISGLPPQGRFRGEYPCSSSSGPCIAIRPCDQEGEPSA